MKYFYGVLVVLFLQGQTFALAASSKVDKVLVMKSDRKLYLVRSDKRVREYNISLGQAPRGHKQRQGDSRTPEGHYVIDYRNPQSQYSLSLHISYPARQDRERARKVGANPGGDIFIHGLPTGVSDDYNRYANQDWTDGCIAVSNKAIKEIWRLVRNGTPIEIRP